MAEEQAGAVHLPAQLKAAPSGESGAQSGSRGAASPSVLNPPPDVFISSGMISCLFLCSFLGYGLLSYLGIKLETVGMRDGLVDKGVCSQT